MRIRNMGLKLPKNEETFKKHAYKKHKAQIAKK